MRNQLNKNQKNLSRDHQNKMEKMILKYNTVQYNYYLFIMTTIYILKLQQNKHYVGRTDDIKSRLNKHVNGKGSYWTMKYPPLRPLKVTIIKNCNVFDEDKYTLMMMAKYGVDDVRGGSFPRITLSPNEKEMIMKMINNASDICFNCQLPGHYIGNCSYDALTNVEVVIMRNKIINNCKLMSNSEFLDVVKLRDILIITDPIIFSGIDVGKIIKICNKINNSNINGIEKLDVDNIYYMHFAIGLAVLCDKKLMKKYNTKKE